MVLGALDSASIRSRNASTSATETVKSRVDSSGQRSAEEADEVHHVLAVGPLRVRARPPGDPALEDFGDGDVEASDLGLDRRRCAGRPGSAAARPASSLTGTSSVDFFSSMTPSFGGPIFER